MAYRYTDVNTRLAYSTTEGTVGQAGKIVQFWANAAGTTPIDVGLYSENTPSTPGASTGSNQLTVQDDSMWPAMWDRTGAQDHMWIQIGTASNPGDLYKVYADADQRLDDLDARVTDLEETGSAPLTHGSSHGVGGSDPVQLAESQVTGLEDDLDSINSRLPDIDPALYGVIPDTGADLSAEFAAMHAAIPAAIGNEIGGGCIQLEKGEYLVNQPTAGVLMGITSKPNVKYKGRGSSTRIRVTNATADELFRIDTCTNFSMEDILFQIIGTSHIGRALHYTTASPGSAHFGRFKNVTVSCNGASRIAGDVGLVSGSPVIYSALAAFAAGDVGGFICIDLSTGPFTSTIQSVATLSGTLAAPMANSLLATTLTLNAVLPGAPASGFTVKVGNERMFVSAGGNTTSLTVVRGRGPDVLVESHSAGDTVVTYSATLADNAPLSVTNATAPGRIQAAGTAIMENGFCLGVDHPGASNIDLANTNVEGLAIIGAAVAGVRVGNGTSGNNLNHWVKGLSVLESGYGMYLNAGQLSIHGGDFDNCMVDIRRIGVCSSPLLIEDIRSESSYGFYSYTGNSTVGSPTTLHVVKVVTCNSERGVPIEHLNSGGLKLDTMQVTGSGTVRGNLLASIGGTVAAPVHLDVVNFGHSGATGDFFASVGTGTELTRTAIKNISNQYRLLANGETETNTVSGSYRGNHELLGGGFGRTPTIVLNQDIQILRTYMKVIFQTLTVTRTATLPAITNTVPAGAEFLVMDGSGNCSGSVKIIVTTPDGKTINGAATHELTSAYGRATYSHDGTQWLVQA